MEEFTTSDRICGVTARLNKSKGKNTVGTGETAVVKLSPAKVTNLNTPSQRYNLPHNYHPALAQQLPYVDQNAYLGDKSDA